MNHDVSGEDQASCSKSVSSLDLMGKGLAHAMTLLVHTIKAIKDCSESIVLM